MTWIKAPSRCAAAILGVLAAATAFAATDITNSLTGFVGNSTQSATQTAVSAAGFNFTSTTGLGEDPPGTFVDPTVEFDSSGAHFGNFFVGDGGRNFLRTNATEYANHSFVAEVTWVTTDMTSQAAYFGLGSAEYGSFRIADWGTEFTAVQLFLEVDPFNPDANVFTLKNDNSLVRFDNGTSAAGLDTGTNRLRMTYDWFRKTADFAIDLNSSGGAFSADITVPTVNTLDLYGADKWALEPGRVYFGGDDGTVFKDFSVTLSSPNVMYGDLNDSGTITSDDWVILRNNLYADVTGSYSDAYFMGDVTADLAIDQADFAAFKTLYDGLNGAGAFLRMISGVPEPTSLLLCFSAMLTIIPVRRRSARST